MDWRGWLNEPVEITIWHVAFLLVALIALGALLYQVLGW